MNFFRWHLRKPRTPEERVARCDELIREAIREAQRDTNCRFVVAPYEAQRGADFAVTRAAWVCVPEERISEEK